WLIHLAESQGGCRVTSRSSFDRSRSRMRNFYFAVFHGAGWILGRDILRRRIRAMAPGATGGGQRRSVPERATSLAGRIVGAAEGLDLAYYFRHDEGNLRSLQAGYPPRTTQQPVGSIVIATL